MMRTHRGIVCETNDEYTVFLTETGDFLRGTPLSGSPDIGDETEFLPILTTPAKRIQMKPRFVAAVMVAAAFFIFVALSFNPLSNDVLAYLQLETDNAVEFSVDQKGNVISLRYLNDSLGGSADSLVEWKGHPIQIVLDTAVKEFSAEARGERIIITSVYSKDKKHADVQVIVEEAVQTVRNEYEELNWEVSEGTERERELANELDLSVHQFKKESSTSPKRELNLTPPSKIEQPKKLPQQSGSEKQIKTKQSVGTTPAAPRKIINEQKKEFKNKGTLNPGPSKTLVKPHQEKVIVPGAVKIAKEEPPVIGKKRPDKGNQKTISKPVQQKVDHSEKSDQNGVGNGKTKQPNNEKSNK